MFLDERSQFLGWRESPDEAAVETGERSSVQFHAAAVQ
jgi:hypothetical protein